MEATNFPRFIPTGNVELITPALAESYMTKNDLNPRKKVDKNAVDAYAADMKSGNFYLNGEPIVFDANGNLKDGQHRLLGIIKAGVPVYMYVIRGIDPSVTTFDYGKRRNMHQELGVSSNLETIANMVISNVYSASKNAKGLIRQYILDHSDDMYKAINYSELGGGTKKHGVAVKRDVYTLIYLLLRLDLADDETLYEFFRVVNTGFPAEGRDSSSAIVLRNKLLSINHSRNNRSVALEQMQFTLNALNDFSAGNSRRRPYKINNTKDVEWMLREVRRMDGLEAE